MLQLGYIEIDYVNAGILKVTPLGRKVLFGEQKAMMAIYKEPEEKLISEERLEIQIPPHQTHPIGFGRRDTTRLAPATRKQIAEREQTPAHIIFSDDSLEDMVQKGLLPWKSSAKYAVWEKSNWKNTERYSWH